MQTENVGTFSLDENVWQGISLSDSAVRQITKLMQQDPQVKGLQLGETIPAAPALPMCWI